MKEIRLKVNTEKPVQLQNFLMKQQGISRRLMTKLKRQDGGITRNGETVRSVDLVCGGDEIVLRLEDTSLLEANPSLNVPVAYESGSVVVFDKPAGMPVHPSIKHQGDTLGNYFAARYPDLTFRPVNRLDKDTSGLCAVAKDALAAKLLQGSIDKVYYAAVQGVTEESGTIDAPIAREQESIILRCVRDDGQPAVTHFRRIGGNSSYSLEEILLETGRTHQIRVHFAYTGHPLAGDDMYGGSLEHITRQALHCGRLTFTEPLTGKSVTVSSELPQEIISLIG